MARDRSIIPFPELEILTAREREQQRRSRDVGRGRLAWKMEKPVIYFAGRMEGSQCGNDWRDVLDVFGSTAGIEYNCADFETTVDCGDFVYGGPYMRCGTGGHTDGHTAHPDEHRDIWDIDRLQIQRADLMVAYLADGQAYGTLVEIGYAAAHQKPIALGFSAKMAAATYDDLWLCRMSAAKIYWGEPSDIWAHVRWDWIAR